jgi:prepilin-type N-terminal cleavage/methylation domain-containing protein
MWTPNRISGGFTMLELLVAMTVLTVVVSIVYVSLTTVLDTAEVARDSAEQIRFRQYIWRSFSENLTAVYSDAACQSPEYQLIGTNVDGPYGPADALRFCTSLPLSGPQALPGLLRVVTYETSELSEAEEESEMALVDTMTGEARQGLTLIIREEPLVLEDVTDSTRREDARASASTQLSFQQDLSELPPPVERRIPIGSIDITYFNPDTKEWDEEWDSMAQARIPWAIRVRINFSRTESQLRADMAAGIDLREHPDMDMTIAIPMGAGVYAEFIDQNHVRATGLLEGFDGVSGAS